MTVRGHVREQISENPGKLWRNPVHYQLPTTMERMKMKVQWPTFRLTMAYPKTGL